MKYEFHSHCLDARLRELSREGNPVPLPRKAFNVLLHLVENRDKMVSKAELLESFWPPAVSEGVLQSTVRQIRRAVGDDGKKQRVIKTYHGEGFRFVAPLSPPQDAAPATYTKGSFTPTGPTLSHPSAGLSGLANPRTAEAAAAQPVLPMPAATLFEEQRLSTVLACRLTCHGGDAAPAHDDPRGSFLAQATRLAEFHGGLVLHVMPDGFTVLFGAALDVEKGTCRAFDCARDLALCAAAQALESTAPAPRFGIDVGQFPVVTARSEARVRGLNARVLKSALKLADAAAPGCAAVSDRAASHFGDDILRHRTPAGEVSLRHIGPALVRSAAAPVRGFESFVGRGAEMSFLSDTLQRMLRGRGEMVVLAGDAGIGKSRLLSEFLAHAERQGCVCLQVASDLRAENTPLAVMADLARELDTALAPFGPDEQIGDQVDRALWHDLLGDGGLNAAALAALTPHLRRQRMFRVIRERVRRLAVRRPTVLAIEDVHWLDESSRDGLDYLAQTLEGVAVLLVVTTRPVSEARDSKTSVVTTLMLPPIGRPEALTLLRSRTERERLGPDDAAALVDRAGGNPFFLEELLMAVMAGADPRAGLPDTVQEVIAVRLGRLSAEARALLLATAVIGPQARGDVMAGAVGWNPSVFEMVLCELISCGVLMEELMLTPRSFRFRHILLQDVAYAMLGPEDRRSLHRRIARILAGADRAAAPERLAWHHQEAGEHLAAIEQWTRAARLAQQRSASREAIAFARNGLRLIDPGKTDRSSIRRELELQLTLAPALAATMGYGAGEVGISYRKARDLSRSADAPHSEFRMLVGLWNYHWVRGELALAHRHAEDLIDLAAHAGEPNLRLRALACMGEILFHLGALPAAAQHLDEACRLFADSAQVRAGTRVPAVACHCYAAWAASFSGKSAEALEYCDRAGAIADGLVQPFSMSLYLSLRAELLLFEEDVAGCLAAAREACSISKREGFPFWYGTALVNLGWAQAHAGDPPCGLASLREGIAVFEATGARVQLANWYGLLAEVLLLAGDIPGARTATETASRWARRTGDVFFLPRIGRTRAALDAAS